MYLYYIHFEVTGYPCNLIGSDLLPNHTIFCSKSHLFLSEWEWDSKTKQPIRFEGFFKLTNHIAGKWKTKRPLFGNFCCSSSSCIQAIKLCDFKMEIIKWQLNFGSCNFGLKSYLWFQIELALCARLILKSCVWCDQIALHSVQLPLLNIVLHILEIGWLVDLVHIQDSNMRVGGELF